jgi:hypothetical protein
MASHAVAYGCRLSLDNVDGVSYSGKEEGFQNVPSDARQSASSPGFCGDCEPRCLNATLGQERKRLQQH